MILRSVLRLSAAVVLGAYAAWPASAQIFSQGTPQAAPRSAPRAAARNVPQQPVPMPRPRPPQMTVAPVAAQPAPVPVSAQPAEIPAPAEQPLAAAPSPAPEPPIAEPPVAVAPVAEPITPAQSAAAPSPSTSDDTPADSASTAALTPSETASPEPGAPLDLAQPEPLPPPSDIEPAPGADMAAADPDQPNDDKKTLRKVNSYFNGISTLVGNFTQIGPDGSRADGKFFLMKPGKVRFYYQRPSTTDIIADGKSLVVRDRKLATQDVYPLNQTPLKFLLDKNLDLARDSKVIAVYEEPGLVSVALEEETTFGGKARILIVFGTEDGAKYELKQWTITDPQGLNTTVSLSELDTSTKPDDKLFAVDYSRDIRRN